MSSEPKVAVSLSRKINLGGYESVDLFFSVSDLAVGATEAEIQEALETGEAAFQLLKRKVADKMREARVEAEAGNL